MELQLKVGDRVRLTAAGVACYGGAWPHWVPAAQGGGSPGTVLFAGERPHKPGAAPRPYFVRWDSGVENSYREEDLEPLPDPEAKVPEPPQEPPTNVVPFRFGG